MNVCDSRWTEAAEPKAVRDDADGTHCHRGAGDDGTEQHPKNRLQHRCGEWDADRIVGKCPE
jgi:hypothetical protein